MTRKKNLRDNKPLKLIEKQNEDICWIKLTMKMQVCIDSMVTGTETSEWKYDNW